MKVARLFERTLGWEFLIRQFGFFFSTFGELCPTFQYKKASLQEAAVHT